VTCIEVLRSYRAVFLPSSEGLFWSLPSERHPLVALPLLRTRAFCPLTGARFPPPACPLLHRGISFRSNLPDLLFSVRTNFLTASPDSPYKFCCPLEPTLPVIHSTSTRIWTSAIIFVCRRCPSRLLLKTFDEIYFELELDFPTPRSWPRLDYSSFL